MNTDTQEAQASIVTDAPVQKQAETQDQEVETQETEAEETEDASPEAESEESEPEKTVEEKYAELKQEAETKQKAIDRKTAAYTALQRAHEKQQQELQAMQEKIQSQEPEKEPSIDDFETHDDYVNALTEYRANKLVKAKESELIEAQQQAKAKELADARAKIMLEKETEYLEINPKYPASKAEFGAFISTANIRPDVEAAIVGQAFKGNPAHIIDYFGSNNGENIGQLEEIASMSAPDAAIEIYKIQQSLTTPAPKENKPPPAPVNKPRGKGAVSKSVDKMDGSDVLKWVNS